MAFTYGIFGRVSLRWVLIVVMVSTVVTPEHSSTHTKRFHRQKMLNNTEAFTCRAGEGVETITNSSEMN